MKLDMVGCYRLAWRSFAKWWIPLCLLSGLIVVFQIAPRMLMRSEVRDARAALQDFAGAVISNDLERMAETSAEAEQHVRVLLRRASLSTAYLFPFIALLTVLLLMQANRAVKNRADAGRPFLFLVYIAVVHVIVAIGKAAAFLLFFFPGVFLYIKLLFVSLIMLEDGKGARAAVATSWRMTTGNFWRLLALVLVNTAVQMLMLPTIIGEIPATGFVNTARAAAFRMLRDSSRVPPEPPPANAQA